MHSEIELTREVEAIQIPSGLVAMEPVNDADAPALGRCWMDFEGAV